MLYQFLYPLSKYVSWFNLFRYITVRSAIGALLSFLIGVIFYPSLIKLLKERLIGQVVREDGPKDHLKKSGTPTMGGILMTISLILTILIAGNFSNPYTYIFIIGIVLFSAVGFIDDYLKVVKQNPKGLAAKYKIILLTFISIFISFLFYYFTPEKDKATLTSLFIPFINFPVINLSLYYILFSSFVLVGTSNAVNLTDGLDGLAAGLVLIVGFTMAIFTYISGHIQVAGYLKIPYLLFSGEGTVIVATMIGSVASFLWYNAHPAEIFMGDTGSILLGGLIGMFSIISKTEVLLIIVGGVFVVTAFSVMIQVVYFKLTGKRIFLMAPLHHHFELKGWKETQIIIRFWIIGGILALIALTTLKIR